MKSVLGVVLFCFATAQSLFAADLVRNGNWWAQQPKAEHPVYISGVFDGLNAGPAILDATSHAAASLVSETLRRSFEGIDVDEMCKRLDSFYRNPRNRPIPTGPAVLLVAYESRATSELMKAEYARDLEAMRAKSAP